jgi:TldD protein
VNGDLRDHEADLTRELKRVGARSTFVEAFAQRTRGATVQVDTKSQSVAGNPELVGVAFRAWGGTYWVESATVGTEERALAGAADELLSRLAKSGPMSDPPGESATTTVAADSPQKRPMREMGSEGALAWVTEVQKWIAGEPSIKFGLTALLWAEEERYYLNSVGANCFQRLDRVLANVLAVAVENGRSETYFESIGRIGGQEALSAITPEKVRTMCGIARSLLTTEAPPKGRMNVILDPGVASTFVHESFGHGTEADQFLRNRSYLQPLLGKTLGPEELTLVDDGTVPGGWGTIRFDDEGHPAQRTPLVDGGRFVGALHDRTTAAVLGAKPTGNTRRADFLSQPYVRMTNTLVEPRDWSYEELVEEARDGIVLERWISGMEDPLGGRMQLKVRAGHVIRNGEVTDLVSSMVLSGSVLEFLRDIRGIGSKDYSDSSPGFCGKGHSDILPVGGGGTYLLSRAVVGPA